MWSFANARYRLWTRAIERHVGHDFAGWHFNLEIYSLARRRAEHNLHIHYVGQRYHIAFWYVADQRATGFWYYALTARDSDGLGYHAAFTASLLLADLIEQLIGDTDFVGPFQEALPDESISHLLRWLYQMEAASPPRHRAYQVFGEHADAWQEYLASLDQFHSN